MTSFTCVRRRCSTNGLNRSLILFPLAFCGELQATGRDEANVSNCRSKGRFSRWLMSRLAGSLAVEMACQEKGDFCERLLRLRDEQIEVLGMALPLKNLQGCLDSGPTKFAMCLYGVAEEQVTCA